jgi:hypothetical protein
VINASNSQISTLLRGNKKVEETEVIETKASLLIASLLLGLIVGGFYGAFVEAAIRNFYIAQYAVLGLLATFWLLAIGALLKEEEPTKTK